MEEDKNCTYEQTSLKVSIGVREEETVEEQKVDTESTWQALQTSEGFESPTSAAIALSLNTLRDNPSVKFIETLN